MVNRMPRLFDRKETARLLSVSVATVKKLASRGELKSVKIGRRVLHAESAIQEFIESHEGITPEA
jgi:excisionase family DNA binding protein